MKQKLNELTPEQKRVMCAEACGIRPPMHDSPLAYDTSLDAMATAEATLTNDEHRMFRRALMSITGERHRNYISATAIQRLAAFLIAKGLTQP